jgi:hypothetical protein
VSAGVNRKGDKAVVVRGSCTGAHWNNHAGKARGRRHRSQPQVGQGSMRPGGCRSDGGNVSRHIARFVENHEYPMNSWCVSGQC